MNIPALPSLTSLVWPVIVAGSLATLLYLTISTQTKNNELSERIDALSTKIDAVQKVNVVNNNYYTTDKKNDQQLMKDAGRSHLLFEKPGLVELKINNSFDEFSKGFDK